MTIRNLDSLIAVAALVLLVIFFLFLPFVLLQFNLELVYERKEATNNY